MRGASPAGDNPGWSNCACRPAWKVVGKTPISAMVTGKSWSIFECGNRKMFPTTKSARRGQGTLASWLEKLQKRDHDDWRPKLIGRAAIFQIAL